MIFIAPSPTADARFPAVLPSGRRAMKPKGRVPVADEDGARRALGPDGVMPAPAGAGPSLEHLARIAFG